MTIASKLADFGLGSYDDCYKALKDANGDENAASEALLLKIAEWVYVFCIQFNYKFKVE